MYRLGIYIAVVVLPFVSGNAQEKTSPQKGGLASIFHNDHLKINAMKDSPIVGGVNSRLVEGVWLPGAADPSKNLVFPQQVKIYCTRYNKICMELNVTIGPAPGLVAINELDDEEYNVDSWDAHGLVASYGGDDISGSPCQRHVLTMSLNKDRCPCRTFPRTEKDVKSSKRRDPISSFGAFTTSTRHRGTIWINQENENKHQECAA